MSEPAAIRAAYVHYQRLKTTKMHQVIFEIPSDLWPAAYKVLGEPDFEASDWWAIAKLTAEAKAEPAAEPKERQKFSRLRPSAQAALLCEKPRFWKFLSEICGRELADAIVTEGEAAEAVRALCCVSSRSELDRDEDAAQIWVALRDKFDAWSFAG